MRKAPRPSIVPLAAFACWIGLAVPTVAQSFGPFEIAWSAHHDTPLSGDELPVAAVRVADLAIVASHVTAGDWWTVAVQVPSGQIAWQDFYDGPAHGADGVAALCVDALGMRAFGAGYSGTNPSSGPVQYAAALRAFDVATGAALWTAHETNGPDTRWLAVAASADGAHVYASGRTIVDGQFRWIVAAYDAVEGQHLWTVTPAAPALVSGVSIAVDPADARVYVSGLQAPSGSSAQLCALSTLDGALVWAAALSSPTAWTSVVPLALAPSGQFVYIAAGAPSAAIAKFRASTGALQWGLEFPDFAPYDLEISPDGARLWSTGVRKFAGPPVLRTISFDDQGHLQWFQDAVFAGVNSALSRAIGSSADGAQVCVTGETKKNNQQPDWVSAGYDALDGTPLWTSTVGQPWNLSDEGVAIVCGAAGADALVIGRSTAGTTGSDALLLDVDAESGAVQSTVVLDLVAGAQQVAADACLSADAQRLYACGLTTGTYEVAEVTAFDASSGALRWSSAITVPPDPQWGQGDIAASTVVEAPGGERVYVGGQLGSAPYTAALASADGATQWEVNPSADPNGVGTTFALVPSADGARVFSAVGIEWPQPLLQARALDAATGDELWLTSVAHRNGPLVAALSPDGARFFVGGQRETLPDIDGLVASFDTSTGALQWQRGLDGVGGSQANDEDRVAGFAGDPSGARVYVLLDTPAGWQVLALAATSGSPQWATAYPAEGVDALATGLGISADGARLFACGHRAPVQKSWVQALDAASGAQLWEHGAFLRLTSSLAVDPDGSKVTLAGRSFDDSKLHAYALDAGSGAELWHSESLGQGGGAGAARVLLAPAGRRAWVVGDSSAVESAQRDLYVEAYDLPRLTSSVTSASLSSGASVDFDLCGGAVQAGDLHVLVGSTNGAAPGFDVDGVHVPLVLDGYLLALLANPNSFITGSLGVLDAHGYADASLTLPPGSDPALAGLVVNHAWVAFDLALGQVVVASNPFALTLAP